MDNPYDAYRHKIQYTPRTVAIHARRDAEHAERQGNAFAAAQYRAVQYEAESAVADRIAACRRIISHQSSGRSADE